MAGRVFLCVRVTLLDDDGWLGRKKQDCQQHSHDCFFDHLFFLSLSENVVNKSRVSLLFRAQSLQAQNPPGLPRRVRRHAWSCSFPPFVILFVRIARIFLLTACPARCHPRVKWRLGQTAADCVSPVWIPRISKAEREQDALTDAFECFNEKRMHRFFLSTCFVRMIVVSRPFG